MRTVGYVTDRDGRRIFALVPVALVKSVVMPRLSPVGPSTYEEKAALDWLLLNPMACLETSDQKNPIRTARETAGITQADLAFAMGISQPMLSRQEQPFRHLRANTLKRAVETIQRIQENRNRPVIPLDGMLSNYGTRLAASAARKPRDPVERRLLREMGDPVALRESETFTREGGERRRPLRKKMK